MQPRQRFALTSQFWIYPVLALSLTALTLLAVGAWGRVASYYAGNRTVEPDEESRHVSNTIKRE